MSIINWEADKMLDVYIYDYFVKRQLQASARAFQAEGNVSTDPIAIDAPNGFLFEWWSVFWDIYISRTDEKHSEAAAAYSKIQLSKAREIQRQQLQEQELNNQNQKQLQMQLFLHRQAQQQQHQQEQQQQQRRGGNQHVSGSASSPISNEPLTRKNRATANAMTPKIYEDRLKLPLQRDVLDDVPIKPKRGGNVGQLLDPNHASLLKAVGTTTGRQSTGKTLLGAPSILQGNPQQVQNQNQQHPGPTQDVKSDMNPSMRSQAAVIPDGSFAGIHGHGSSQGVSNLTLKGWPLAGLEQLRSELLQQNNLLQSPHSFNQLSLQQQLALQQAQHSLVSPSFSDFERLRLRALLNQNMGYIKDGRMNSVGELIPNITQAQVGSSILPLPDSDSFLKQVQKDSQPLQQYLQLALSSQQQAQSVQQQEKNGSCSKALDGCIPGTLLGNDQAPKSQIGRKRKQASSSGPANSSGTANTTGPSSSSPSTPSTQTHGDVPTQQQNVPSSKSLVVFGTDGLGSLTSARDQLVGDPFVILLL